MGLYWYRIVAILLYPDLCDNFYDLYNDLAVVYGYSHQADRQGDLHPPEIIYRACANGTISRPVHIKYRKLIYKFVFFFTN